MDITTQHNVMSKTMLTSTTKSQSKIFNLYKEYKANEKRLNHFEFQQRLFRRMKSGYEQSGLPGQPQNVKLSVTSDSSLSVQFDSPENDNSAAAITRYKVEWSRFQNFKPLVGEVFIHDLQNLRHDITGLECGKPYYVRVTAWNMKGFGKGAMADPLYAIPSSWRDVDGMKTRPFHYNLHMTSDVMLNLRKAQSDPDVSNVNPLQSNESPPYQRKASSAVPLMKGLKGLFSSTFKFQKSLKRGLYVALVCYNEDKILITTEDNLPLIEIDEGYNSSTTQADYEWMMRVLSTSIDTIRQLKQDMDKLPEHNTAQLRSELLSAILQIQETIGSTDLGRLFYKPVDSNGCTVFVLTKQLVDPKQTANVSSAVKWQTQSKLIKNASQPDLLLPLLNEIMFYNDMCTKPLTRGLYMGYLHIKVHVENIRVLTPETKPSVLPYIKIRDCPNVSKPEWQSLLDINRQEAEDCQPVTEAAEIVAFKKQLMKSAKKLADKLGLPLEDIGSHQIYDVEVLDFSKDVSFILLVPPRDAVCSVQSAASNAIAQSADAEQVNGMSTEYMEMPVKAFENIHLHTYQPSFIQSFCKAACTVDAQMIVAQQQHREAFLNEEVEQTKRQVETTRECQQRLEGIWRSSRWLMDAITYARDKSTQGISLRQLYDSILEQSALAKGDYYTRCSDDGYYSDKLSTGGSTTSERQPQSNTNNNNGQYYDGEYDYHHRPSSDDGKDAPLAPDIIRVYAAYNSGLAKGTSVMLHVTPKTTAREVVNLVVMQLNQATLRKGLSRPVYSEEQLPDFCLVAVIGPRERVLRDDYKLLQLQNPWTKGRLYVRLKHNLLAALEHGETTEV